MTSFPDGAIRRDQCPDCGRLDHHAPGCGLPRWTFPVVSGLVLCACCQKRFEPGAIVAHFTKCKEEK